MKKTFKGVLALAFCIVTVFATMIIAAAVDAPKAKVKAVTYNTATISWAAVKGADGGYEIQRSTSSKSGFKTIATTTSTSYKDSKLTTGKTYYYRVRAVDKTLFGKRYSSWTSVVKANPVPSKVTGVKASPNYNSIKLTWSKVSGASGYEIQVYSSKKWKAYKTASKNTITISKLKLGTTYQYRIRAYKTVSKKKVYGDFSSTIKATPTLKAPSSFVLKGVSTSSLTLSWSAVDGAKGYEVYNASTKKWTNTKTKRSLTVKKLKAGTKYGFIVRAYSGKYDGTKTKTLSFYTTPSAPSGLKVSKAAATTLDVSWSKVTGAAGYQVQYSTDGKKWTSLSGTAKTTATIKSLKSATKYYVRVRAYVKNSNVKDISATSYGAYSSKLTAYTAPAAPSSITYSGITAGTVTISWKTVSGATGYEVYNPVTKKWVDVKTAATYKFSSLKAATDYTFKVRAYSKYAKSSEKTITVTTTPAKVTGVSISDLTPSSFKATWSKVTGADGYNIYIYDYSTNKQTTLASTTSLSYTFKNLKENTKYKIAISSFVKNSNGNTYADLTWYDNITTYASNTIIVTWPKVSGANNYSVERFNPQTHTWDSITTTSALSYRDDSQADNSAALYRISAYNNSTFISSVQKEVANFGISVSKATNTITVGWNKPVFQNSSKPLRFYSVFELPRKGSGDTEEKLVCVIDPSKTKHTFFTAHGTEQTYVVYAHNDTLDMSIRVGYIYNEERRIPVAKFTVRAEELAINDTDVSKTGQLLMLTDAINRTKYEQGIINVTRDSVTSVSTDEISIESPLLGVVIAAMPELLEFADGPTKISAKGPDEILKFMNAMDEKDTATKEEISKTEAVKESVSFEEGLSFSTTIGNGLLHYYIDPTETLPYTAYLYNSENVSAWKNGFSSVSTSKSNGNYILKATIKAEKYGTSVNQAKSFYHGGFCSLFDELDFTGADGMENKLTDIAATNITAVINSKGQLVSYSFSDTKMTSDYEMNQDGLKMNLKASASTAFKYDFTYGSES